MKEFGSNHRVSARAVAEPVREASGALDSSEKGGYQQSVEPKVNESAEHGCCWLGVVVVEDEEGWQGRER